jgi:hypothetical protein
LELLARTAWDAPFTVATKADSNMNFITPRIDILPPAQQMLWPILNQIEPGFVLYGGTAIALYYGHRESVDFDFFGEPNFNPDEFKEKYNFLKEGITIQAAANTLSVVVPSPQGEVKLSFLGGLKCGRVRAPSICEDTLIRLASPLDLAVQKLKVIRVRSEAKDYRDLDCLLQKGINLAEAMGAAETIYPGFPVAITLRAMCYFEEGDVPTISNDLKKRLTAAVQNFASSIAVKKESEHLDIPAEVVEKLKTTSQHIAKSKRSQKVAAARAEIKKLKNNGKVGGRHPGGKR